MRVIVCFFLFICNKDTEAVGVVLFAEEDINYNIPLPVYLKRDVEIIKFSSVKLEFMSIEIIYCICVKVVIIVQVIVGVMTMTLERFKLFSSCTACFESREVESCDSKHTFAISEIVHFTC